MQWVTLIRMRQVSRSYLDLHTVYNPHTIAKTVPRIRLKPSPTPIPFPYLLSSYSYSSHLSIYNINVCPYCQHQRRYTDSKCQLTCKTKTLQWMSLFRFQTGELTQPLRWIRWGQGKENIQRYDIHNYCQECRSGKVCGEGSVVKWSYKGNVTNHIGLVGKHREHCAFIPTLQSLQYAALGLRQFRLDGETKHLNPLRISEWG